MNDDDNLSDTLKHLGSIKSSCQIIETFYGKVQFKKIGKDELAFIESIAEQMLALKNKTLGIKDDYEERGVIPKDAMEKILMIFPQ